MENFEFNPIYNKTPQGTSVIKDKVKYELKVLKSVLPKQCYFVYHKDGEQDIYEPMKQSYSDNLYFYYTITLSFKEVGHYWYCFKVIANNEEFYLEKDYNFNVIKTYKPNNYYLQLVHKPIIKPDDSFSKGIIYHIFVDSFCRVGTVKGRSGLILRDDWNGKINRIVKDGILVHNECFGGTLKGIISKLKYIKSLNTSTIYLSPIFEAHSSHKYDVADYEKIDSMFGTEKDFQNLLNKAQELDINIILDGVFNHTGSDSVYFNKEGRYSTLGAYQSPQSKYYNWYSFIEYPNNYEAWWGIKHLPQTNEKEPSFVNFICGENGIIKKYMKMGVKGFRLDVADELSDNFIEKISSSISSVYKKPLIVGEVWEDASSKISYSVRRKYFLGNELNSVTNYPIKNGIISFVKHGNLSELCNVLCTILDQYPYEVQNNLMNILDTHDTARILTMLGASEQNLDNTKNYKLTKKEREKAIHLLKMATIIQYTVMGIPTVFYGDETGIEGTGDPFCRACYPWGNEDKELIKWYKMLGELRSFEALNGGEFKFVFAENNVLIYERIKKHKKITVAINKSEEEFTIKLKKPMIEYFTGEQVNNEIKVGANNYLVLVSK